MSAVTHKRVSDEVIDPALDARSLNLHEARILARLDTPECDSMIERIRALRDRPIPFRPGAYVVEDGQIDQLEDDVWDLVEYNGREGQCERTVAGNGERIARDLRPANGGVSLRPRNVARLLRPVLDVLVDPGADPMDYVRAGRDWHAIERQVPRATLLCRSLVKEIGKTKAAKLRELLGEEGG